MLRFKVKEMIARREFEEGRRITIAEVAEASESVTLMTKAVAIEWHKLRCDG